MNTSWIQLKKQFILGLVILAFMGCVPGLKSVNKSFDFKKGEKKGLVVVTLSVHEKSYYSLYPFINVKQPEKQLFILKGGANSDDFDKGGYEGTMSILALEEGDYQFQGWSSTHITGCGHRCTQYNKFYGRDVIPFKVKAGKVTYLGEFRMGLNDPPKNGGKYTHRLLDSRKRDLKIFSKKMKNFSEKNVKVRLGKTTGHLNDDQLEVVMTNVPQGL